MLDPVPRTLLDLPMSLKTLTLDKLTIRGASNLDFAHLLRQTVAGLPNLVDCTVSLVNPCLRFQSLS